MRAIDADAITYESIDSTDTGRHEHFYGTGIIAVRKEDIDAMPTIQPKRGTWIDTRGTQGGMQENTDAVSAVTPCLEKQTSALTAERRWR